MYTGRLSVKSLAHGNNDLTSMRAASWRRSGRKRAVQEGGQSRSGMMLFKEIFGVTPKRNNP